MNPIGPEVTSFIETQRLLQNLLQALQVFSSPGGAPARPSFSKYLFTGIPADKPEPRFRHQVQLLAQILQKASTDVELIIEQAKTPQVLKPKGEQTVQPGRDKVVAPNSQNKSESEQNPVLKDRLSEEKTLAAQPQKIAGEIKSSVEIKQTIQTSLSSRNEKEIPSARLENKPTLERTVPQKNGETKPLGKLSTDPKEPETKDASPTTRPSKERQTFPKMVSSDHTLSFPRKTPPQITAPVKSLMEQVRQAIQALSTSGYLEKPEKAPVTDILRRIKPLIDQLIQVVETQEDMQNGSDEPMREIKALPDSPRKNPFNPDLPRLISKERGEGNKKIETPERTYRPLASEKEEKGPEKKEGSKRAFPNPSPSTKQPIPLQPGSRTPNPYVPPEVRNYLTSLKAKEEVKKGEVYEKGETLVLPGAPYTPEKKPAETRSKQKKKRKGFWTREDKEDEPPP